MRICCKAILLFLFPVAFAASRDNENLLLRSEEDHDYHFDGHTSNKPVPYSAKDDVHKHSLEYHVRGGAHGGHNSRAEKHVRTRGLHNGYHGFPHGFPHGMAHGKSGKKSGVMKSGAMKGHHMMMNLQKHHYEPGYQMMTSLQNHHYEPRYPSCPPRKPHKRKDDLGCRYNKFVLDRHYHGPAKNLDWNDYPLSDQAAYDLQHYSTAFSVVSHYDYEVRGVCIEKYIQAVGGYPTFPSSNPNSPFWSDFREVVQAQINRRIGILPPRSVFTLPRLWQNYTAFDVAEAVHDEYPGTNHVNLITQLVKEGLEIDYDILPFRSKIDFIGLEVRLATLNTWAIGEVAPINFMAKWHVGRPRPEEVAWQIETNQKTRADGVDPVVVGLVKSMNLNSQTSFTQYPEGSPNHPSWPAMHSAASSASLWLAVVTNLTPDQYCQVLRTDYAVAYARTVAGVHYPTDNIAGLNMGQEVVAERLAQHLAWKYGSDEGAVRAKIEALRFDWNSYSPGACTVHHRFQSIKHYRD